jgi:dihydrofolate synthase/folylpolyglutamate synthase
VVILEVGLGGRLDATNATRTDISAITTISLDHEDILGETISSIAREKAGIIRTGNRVILGKNLPRDAMIQIKKIADEKSAPLVVARDYPGITLIPGYQNHNAEIAYTVAKELTPTLNVSEDQIINGLVRFRWAARWQTFHLGKNRIIIDGAHNEAGAIVVADEIRRSYGMDKPTVIFTSNYISRATKMLKILATVSSKVYLTRSVLSMCLMQNDLQNSIPSDSSIKFRYVAFNDMMKMLLSELMGNVVITGSLYLAGDVIRNFNGLDVDDYENLK